MTDLYNIILGKKSKFNEKEIKLTKNNKSIDKLLKGKNKKLKLILSINDDDYKPKLKHNKKNILIPNKKDQKIQNENDVIVIDNNEEQQKNKEEREKIAYQAGEHFGKIDIIDPIFDKEIKELKDKIKNTPSKTWKTIYKKQLLDLEKEKEDVINNNKPVEIKKKKKVKNKDEQMIDKSQIKK